MFEQVRSLKLQVGIGRKVTVAPAIVNSMAKAAKARGEVLRRKTLFVAGADQIARQLSYLGTADERIHLRDRL